MKRFLLAVLFVCAAVPLKAQTVQLPPWTHSQFFAQNGTPLIGGCVFTYQGGTTTPLSTYTDSTGGTPNSDPIILDAGGFANIWLTSGVVYKFSVYSTGGTNCNQGTLQWTVDGIASASGGSGGGAATSLTSASSNPASSGVIRLAKGDQFCWRNTGNSANLCLSVDANNNLTWSGVSLALTEGVAPGGMSAEDIIWADNTAHRLLVSNNGGAAVQLVVSGADINTSDQVTVTHLAAALPVAQGGTGQTSGTGSGLPVFQTSPTITGAVFNNGASETNFSGGIYSGGTGLQHVRFTGCTTSAGSSGCTGSANWNATWADTNYTMTCTAIINDQSVYVSAGSKSTTGFTFVEWADTGTNNTPEIDCIGIHD